MPLKQIALVVVSLILIGGLVKFFISKSSQVPKKTTEIVTASPTPSPLALSTWTDEAGFSFQYPEGTSVDKHPEDTKNYANLTLTLPSQETISVLMSDNKFKDLETAVGQNSALDTTLGGTAAKKFFGDGQETVICIDNGVLVTIAGKDIDQIVSSWIFIYPTKAATVNSKVAPSDGGNVLEEE